MTVDKELSPVPRRTVVKGAAGGAIAAIVSVLVGDELTRRDKDWISECRDLAW